MSFWQLFLNNPEWALVGVGILTLIVIGWQAVATANAAKATQQAAEATQASSEAIERQVGIMERQTKATEDAAIAAKESADTAKLNANVVINSERAWIIATRPSFRFIQPLGRNRNISYDCYIMNVGQTPSRILEVGITLRKIESLEKIPSDPTATYRTEEIRHFSEIVLVPNESISISAELFPELEGNEFQSIRNRTLFLYGYGFVKYLDVFNEPRESRFCHYYYVRVPGDLQEKDGFEPCIQAPPEYHKAI